MVRLFILLAIGVFIASPSLAAGRAESAIKQARSDCQASNGGTFDPKDAVQRVDLTGDGKTDTVIDTSRFSCTTSASNYCGSGGCTLHAIIGDKVWKFQAEGWRMIDWDGRPILLIARDGGWCGGAGAELCYEAVSWNNDRMMTVMSAAK